MDATLEFEETDHLEVGAALNMECPTVNLRSAPCGLFEDMSKGGGLCDVFFIVGSWVLCVLTRRTPFL